MYLIQRRELRAMLTQTLVVFAFVGVIISTTQVLNQLLRIIDAAAGLGVVLRMYLLVIPTITVSVLPLAYLIGAMSVFDRLDEDRESVIVVGAGVHPAFLLVPAAVLAAVLGGVILLVSLVVEPAANRLNREIIDGLTFDMLRVIAGDGALREVEPGLFVRGGGFDAEGRIDGVFVLDRRNPAEEVTYAARSGAFVEAPDPEGGAGAVRTWLRLTDGEIQIRDRSGTVIHKARFHEYLAEPGAIVGEPGAASLGPRQTGTARLQDMLLTGETDGFSEAAIRKELIRRYTDWLYPLAFFGICAFLVLRSRFTRREHRWRLPLALVAGLALKAAGLAVLGNAGAGGLAAGASYGLPVGAAALLVAAALLTASRAGRRRRARARPG